VRQITVDAFAASRFNCADLLATTSPSNPGLESRHLDLGWIVSHDFRHSLESADLTGHANPFSSVCRFRIIKLRAIVAPDDQRKNLVGIGLVEIQKGWTAATALCPARAHHLAADRCLLPDVSFGFRGREGPLGQHGRSCQQGKRQHRQG
jgi:hypothetical protein